MTIRETWQILEASWLARATWRGFKRMLIFAVGVSLAYFIPIELFPYFDDRTPFVIAFLLTYLSAAYLLIPTGIRFYRTLFKPTHIPDQATTPDGFACDPVNVGVVATRKQLIDGMTKAGWIQADPRTLRNLAKQVFSTVLGKDYPSAPFSPLFLFGRSQDIGFQKGVPGSHFKRHHVRYWAVSNAVAPEFRSHVYFWHQKINLKRNQKLLWVGASIKDTGIGFIRFHGQITHTVDADTNAERDLIISDLERTGRVTSVQTVTAGDAYETKNRVLGNNMISDGTIKIADLT